MGKQLGSTLDLPQVATPSASPAAARQLLYAKSDGKLYTKNPAGTEALVGPSGEYTAGQVAGAATWLRLATLDGLGTSTGASFTAIISGYGNFGNANRGTTFLHVGQRGDNLYTAKAWNFGNATTTSPQTYLVKQISTWVFEVWVSRPTFDAAFGMQVLSKWNTTVNFDSESTTIPTGTLTPVTNVEITDPALKLDKDSTPSAEWRAGHNMTGGGTISIAADGSINWTTRLIIMANGTGTYFSTTGYFDITMPTVGAAITPVGTTPARNVTASGILLNVWDALYYILPIGSSSASVPANFRVVNYTGSGSPFVVPDSWVLIAVRNGESGAIRVGNGITLNAGQSWVATNTINSFTGTLTVARGGTGGTATPTLGGVIVGTGVVYASTGIGTTKQVLASNAAAQPTWQTLDLTYIPDAWVKRSVKAASVPITGNVNITTGGPLTVDGISVVAGDRVLLKDQTITSQNGIYQVNAGAWTRATDADVISEVAGATVNVDQGTQGGQMWTTTIKPTDVIDSTAMNWYRLLDTSMIGASGGPAAFLHTHTKGNITDFAHTIESHSNILASAPTVGDGLIYEGSAWNHRPLVLSDIPDAWVKRSVRVASLNMANVVIATGGLQTVDGVVTAAGDRVLLKNQTLPAENGIYQVNVGAWTRTTDADAASEIGGGTVNVDQGTQGGQTWTTTFKTTDTVGTTAMSWYRMLDATQINVQGGVAATGHNHNNAAADFNSLTTVGYIQNTVSPATNSPETGFFMGITTDAQNVVSQTIWNEAETPTDTHYWRRHKPYATGVWGSWYRLRASEAELDLRYAQLSHTHVATTDLTATGTKNATTFLRGDNTWAVPAGGGGGSSTPAAYAGRYLAGTQNITAGAVTTVLWDTQTATPVGIGYNAATGEFTVTADGIYTIAASCAWPINTTGNARSTILLVNGTTRAQTGLPPSALSTTGMGVEVVHTLSLTAGDKISVQVYQNSTANPLALYPSEAFTRIAITANGAGSSSTATPLAMGKYINTGIQSIPDATWTRITGLTTIWLDGGATRTTDYIVVPVTGRYAIAGYLGWASSPSGSAFRRIVGIGRNWTIATPSSNIIGSTETPATAGQTTFPSTRYYEEFDLVAGDIICLLGYQNSGAALNTMTTTQNTMLSVRQIPMTSGGASSASGGNSLVGAATIATDSATMAAGVETLRLAASFTGQTGQQYRIKAMCVPRIDTAAGYVNPRLRWDTAGTGVTGTLLELGQTDFRVANRPEGMYLESPPFTYIGTNNATLYAKLTLSFGGGIGYDNSLTIGPTWVEIEAVGPPGTAGQVTVQPRMRATKTANWTTPLATWNLVTGWTTAYDTYAGFDGTYYTVPVDGTYFVSAASGEIATNSAGRRVLNIEIGGSGVNPGVGTIIIGAESMSATSPVNLTAATDVYLTAGQQVRVCLFNSAAVNQTVSGSLRPSVFTIRKVEA